MLAIKSFYYVELNFYKANYIMIEGKLSRKTKPPNKQEDVATAPPS